MTVSSSGERLRILINKAIDDGKITPTEYDAIISLVEEDGHVDAQERALLRELQMMIEDKTIRFTNK